MLDFIQKQSVDDTLAFARASQTQARAPAPPSLSLPDGPVNAHHCASETAPHPTRQCNKMKRGKRHGARERARSSSSSSSSNDESDHGFKTPGSSMT
mmetsp:Transcript_44360/g.111780  ORF Transcript_44360/g.111780 Transcript_44360/m.111780 type:complete len:97 (-) Transcript_44360:275-565(-)